MKPNRLLALFLIAGISSAGVASEAILSATGYGEIRFGAKLAEVEAKLKQDAAPQKQALGCDFVRFKKYPHVRFMVEDGVITRADAEAGIKNSAGVAVGMTFARVKVLHPNVRIEPHKYDDKGHYLILPTDDGRAAILLEEGHGKITDVRAGIKP